MDVRTALSRLSFNARGFVRSWSVSAVTGGVADGTSDAAGLPAVSIWAASAAGRGEGAGLVVFFPPLVCAKSGMAATAQVSNINRRTAVIHILLELRTRPLYGARR